MYCPHCHRRLFYRDLSNCGWCDDCADIVHVSECSVSYWIIGAICVMCLSVQMYF